MARFPLLTPEGTPYRPLPSQAKFHRSEADFKAYIGGFGSGKTLCGAVEAFLTALKYPGSHGVITRWSYRELEATSFKDFLSIVPPGFVERHYKNTNLVVFKNGSTVRAFNLQNHRRLTSLNLSWAWIDEVTEIEESSFLQLQGRLRGTLPRRLWVTGNPNGKDWVWKTFVDEQRDGYAFYHAKTNENKYLPEAYYENLRAHYPPEWVERFLEGSFDVLEGQIYDEFSASIHGIGPEEEFQIPGSWPRFRGIDHGIYHPTCCLWAAMSPGGDLVFYDSYYHRNRLISENCAEICRRSGNETYEWTVIDPNVDRRDATTGTSYLDEYRRNGVQCIKGQNAILDGISRVKELMRIDPDHPHLVTGRMGAPRYYVFLARCPELVWETQQYKWRDQKPGAETRDKEEPVDRHNHAIDAARYIAMQNPRSLHAHGEAREWDRWQALIDDIKGEDEKQKNEYQIGSWIK